MTDHGAPEMRDWRADLSLPAPGPGDVLVRVAAAGVNTTDIHTRIGWYSKGDAAAEDASLSGKPLTFPRIQDADIGGTIAAAGAGVPAGRTGANGLGRALCAHGLTGTFPDAVQDLRSPL